MLDEILEYQQYTFNIDDPKERVQRLKRSTVLSVEKDKSNKGKLTIPLTGLNRVLTIIASHFLFEVYGEDDDQKEKTIDALKSWLGHKEPDSSVGIEANRLYNWFPLYVEKIILAENIEKLNGYFTSGGASEEDIVELNTIIDQWSARGLQEDAESRFTELCKPFIPGNDHVEASVVKCFKFCKLLAQRRSFNTSIYTDSQEANTVNAITYERVLGNARRAGGLKRYYLACSHSRIADVKKASGRKLKETDWDVVLKLTASCMMKLSKNGNQKVQETRKVSITEADFINWLILKKCDKDKQQAYLYKGKAIFEFPADDHKENNAENTKWIKLNQQWFEDSEFEILKDDPDTDVIKAYLESHPDGSVFVDKGTGVPMEEIKNN